MATTITKPATAPVIHRARGHWQSIDFRDQSGTGDGTNTFTGTAAVTGEITTLYEGLCWEWREQIAPDAFLACLAEIRTGGATYPVVLTHEHDNRAVMASTDVAGNLPYGLELAETPEGLRVFARLDPTDMDVQRIAPKLRAGAIQQMSFAFIPGRITTVTEETPDGRVIETDTVEEIRELLDVTVCAHGAYPTTTADLRGLWAASGRSITQLEGHMRDRPDGGHDEQEDVAPTRVGDQHRHNPALAHLRRRLRAVAATHPKETN